MGSNAKLESLIRLRYSANKEYVPVAGRQPKHSSKMYSRMLRLQHRARKYQQGSLYIATVKLEISMYSKKISQIQSIHDSEDIHVR